MKNYFLLVSLLSMIFIYCCSTEKTNDRKTIVGIRGEQFLINGNFTYKNREWKGHKIEGLLFNSRMVQGIFDDYNPETVELWKYPDSQKWDPERNTNEFIKAMDDWYAHGLLAVTINLQGGSPTGYGNKDWYNSAFTENGDLRVEYMYRLEKILNKADDIGMVVILGYFYFGQDQNLADEKAVVNATKNITNWILEKGYRNVLVEVDNECNHRKYDHEILKPSLVSELIELVKNIKVNGERLLVGISFGGGLVPTPNVVKVSDFILLHGNGVKDSNRITDMVKQTRALHDYKPMPILFNEDDHYNFDKPMNNFVAAISEYASWGYFDYRMEGEGFDEGFQSVPVNWKISSERKRRFFEFLKEISGN